MLLTFTLAGCVTVVQPPPAPVDPVDVYLLDHGRTPSLVLPGDESTPTRWAYGDWRWYALGERGVADAWAALFRPTQAGLGRQELPVPPQAPAGREATAARQAPAFLPALSVPVEELYPIAVERRQAAALAERLEALFRERIHTLEPSESSGLDFVHHPEPYALLHNSNRVVADWLRELGCDVRGQAILSRWRVLPAGGGGGRPPPPAHQPMRRRSRSRKRSS